MIILLLQHVATLYYTLYHNDIVSYSKTVELTGLGWLLRVQHVMTPYWVELYCHAHLRGPTATTDLAFF